MEEVLLKKRRGKSVVVYDWKDRYIRTYDSMKECSEKTGICVDKIRMLIRTGKFEKKIGLYFDFGA